MNLLALLILICSCKPYTATDIVQEIEVDINRHSMEIIVKSNTTALKFICTFACNLMVPDHVKLDVTEDISRNNITLYFHPSADISGNYSICPSNVSQPNSSIEFYSLPSCCHCCLWYDQRLCDRFMLRITNCFVVVVYSSYTLTNSHQFIKVAQNTNYLLPCKMRKFLPKDKLTIDDQLFAKTLLIGNHDGNVSIFVDKWWYHPNLGLCINTSSLSSAVYFDCLYSTNQISMSYSVQKFDLGHVQVDSLLMLVDDTNNKTLSFSKNQDQIKLLRNHTIKVECRAKYMGNLMENLKICMKFYDEYNNGKSPDFDCREVKKGMSLTVVVGENTSSNETKLVCEVENLSKDDLKTLELKIDFHDNEFLEIVNFQQWNHKLIKVFFYNYPITIRVPFESSLNNEEHKCELTSTEIVGLRATCLIETVGECVCEIKTATIIDRRTPFNISLSIHKNALSKTISMVIQPIFVKNAKVTGLTTIIEPYKIVRCETLSTKPYNITWIIEFNNQNSFIYYSAINEMVINLNDSLRSCCVSCDVENEAGSTSSKRVCRTFSDVDFTNDNYFEIFLVDALMWNSTKKTIQHVNRVSFNNTSYQILDIKPLILYCASNITNQPIDIIFNNTIMNSSVVLTNLTRQNWLTINVDALSRKNFSGTYFCRQHQDDKTSLEKKSHISVTMIPTIIPQIKANFMKTEFTVGDNVHLLFNVRSFPPSRAEVFCKPFSSTTDSFRRKNVSINYVPLNSTVMELHINLYNISDTDSGEYLILISSGIKNASYKFNFSVSKSGNQQLIIPITIAAGVLLMVIFFAIVIRCFQKSGYAVPIIQIQNNLYKSLDADSIELLNHIWSDPFERKKWTIKPSSQIKIIKEIGEGNYGKIFKGVLINQNSLEQFVALKQPILSNHSEKTKHAGSLQFCQISLDCFMREIKVLSKLSGCPYIIRMIGCTVMHNGTGFEGSAREPTTLLVLEYYKHRSLNEFLIKNSTMFSPYTKFRKLTDLNGYTGMKMDEGITLLDLKKIARGIAGGLEFLSTLNIIHRDLATRNVLIDDQKCPKICDFGLAIELEDDISHNSTYQIITQNKALPFKILAPEVLESKSFCLESDIWSFGLLLWQMFNLEQEPLFSKYDNPNSLLEYIRSCLVDDGMKDLLSMPKYADDPIWKLIKSCLTYNYITRPSASILRLELMEIVRNSPVELIRVSSNNCQSELHESTYHDSIGSSKFPSTTTSIITLNYPAPLQLTDKQNPYFINEFSNEMSVNESPL